MTETLQFLLVAAQAIGTMLAVGLELRWVDITRTLSQTRPVVLGLVLNLLLLPVATVLLLFGLHLPEAVAAGVLLAGACAGGNSAVLLTRNVHGDTAYAVTLLCLNNLLSLAVLPPLLAGVAGPLQLAPLPALEVARQALLGLAIYMLAPLAVGMVLRSRVPLWAARWAPRFARIANLSLLTLILAMMLAHAKDLAQFDLASLAAMLVLILLSFGLATRIASPASALGRAVLFSSGIRNLSLALLLAQLLQLPALATLSILTYGFLMYLLVLGLWWALNRYAPA
ncbi:MAG: bile acid:sodium symporter [Pseudomonadota bacterium]